MADLQIGALPTTLAAGVDTDYTAVSRGSSTGRMLRSEWLLDVPRLVSPVTESGTTWNITEAGHAYREVTGSNAAAITATFVFTGMVADLSSGIIRQGAAGVVTLAGATVVYAPHLSATQGNSPNTGAARGWLEWVFRGGSTIEIVARSESSGGASNVSVYGPVTATAPTDANENVLLTLPIGSTINAGSVIKVTSVCRDTGAPSAGQGVLQLRLNGTTGAPSLMSQYTFPGDSVPDRTDAINIVTTGAAAQFAVGAGFNVQGSYSAKTNSTSGANSLTISSQRTSGPLTRPISVTLMVEVVRA